MYELDCNGLFTATATASPRCEHGTGWYSYVPFLLFRRYIFTCSDCGDVLYGERLKDFIDKRKQLEVA